MRRFLQVMIWLCLDGSVFSINVTRICRSKSVRYLIDSIGILLVESFTMMSEIGEHASLTEWIDEKIHEYKGSSSSSSDSENDKPSSHGRRKKHLFGRKASLHAVLGGGKCMSFYSPCLVIFQILCFLSFAIDSWKRQFPMWNIVAMAYVRI